MSIVDVHSYTDSPFKKAQPDTIKHVSSNTIKQISAIKSHHATTTLTLLSLSLSLSLIHGQMHTWHICIYVSCAHSVFTDQISSSTVSFTDCDLKCKHGNRIHHHCWPGSSTFFNELGHGRSWDWKQGRDAQKWCECKNIVLSAPWHRPLKPRF